MNSLQFIPSKALMYLKPFQVPVEWVPEALVNLSCRAVKLTTHSHLVLGLQMSGGTVSSVCTEKYIYYST